MREGESRKWGDGLPPSQAPGWLLTQPSALSAIEHHSLTHNPNHMVGRHASMHFQSSDLLIVNHVIREYAHRVSQRRQQWQQLEDHLKVEHGKLLELHTHSERGERHFGDFNAISMPPRNLLTFDCTLVSCTVQSGLHCCTNQGCAQH